MLSFKNRLLKVKLKTRDEFTADCIKEKKKDLFAIQFTGEDENIDNTTSKTSLNALS
jgi:hypothetical protein